MYAAPPPPAATPQYAAPQWQQAPAAPQFAPPPAAYAAPAYAAAPASASPAPPALHWALVLLLSFFTGGLFGFIWFCLQAAYVKRIDPSSKARMLIVFGVLLTVAQVLISLAMAAAAASGSETAVYLALGLSLVLMLASGVCLLSAVFGMRSSLVCYFNTAEPINLRLSGLMTFFFNMLYFQYHLSRIADWKRTGVLT